MLPVCCPLDYSQDLHLQQSRIHESEVAACGHQPDERMRPPVHLGFSMHEVASVIDNGACFQLERVGSCPELGSARLALTQGAPAVRYSVPDILEPPVLSQRGPPFNRAGAGSRTGRPIMLAVREATEPTRADSALALASPPERVNGPLPSSDYSGEATAQIDIGCDAERALAAYADLERFPEYAPLLQSVRITGDGRSAWALQVPRVVASVARAIGMGSLVRWESINGNRHVV